MGLLRLTLALSVIAGHSETTVFGLTWIDKFYAVQAFFVISGFYMSMVLNEKYDRLKLSRFYRSRVLRIFPGYFLGLVLMFIADHGTIKKTLISLTPTAKLIFIVQNMMIFGQDTSLLLCFRNKSGVCTSPIQITINPPAWSLSVELGFYLIAPFIVRKPSRIMAFITIGIIYHLSVDFLSFPVNNLYPFGDLDADSLRYYFYPSSFIFFGAGALAYHIGKSTVKLNYLIFIITILSLQFVYTQMPPAHLLVFSLAIPQLFRLTKHNAIDRFIGELSFPVYILHWPMLTWLHYHLDGHEWLLRYLSLGSMVALLSCSAGLAFHLIVERRIARYRHPSIAEESIKTIRLPVPRAMLCALYILGPSIIILVIVIRNLLHTFVSDSI